jgi:hypothetical protein
MFDPLNDPALLARRRALIDALGFTERVIARVQARQLRIVAELAAQEQLGGFAEVEQSWTREEVACALRVPTSTAAYRIGLAQAVTERLGDALAMLTDGALSLMHVARLAELTAPLTDEQTAAVQARVLPGAERQTAAQLVRQIRRAVAAVAPAAEQAAHEQAMTERRVVIRPADAGMAELWALLPADTARTVAAALDHTAESLRTTELTRTADQLRADSLGHWAHCALAGTAATAAVAPGARAHVQVTVAASTLAGLDDAPGELDGHGPIPAGLARMIAFDPTSRWRRLLLNDAGQLLDYGRRSYRPPIALAEHVTVRDRTCRFPVCQRSPRHADLDHLIAWKNGGTTDEHNLHVLCRRHHRLKHQAGWKVSRAPDGATTWASRTGHTYTRPPDPYPAPA